MLGAQPSVVVATWQGHRSVGSERFARRNAELFGPPDGPPTAAGNGTRHALTRWCRSTSARSSAGSTGDVPPNEDIQGGGAVTHETSVLTRLPLPRVVPQCGCPLLRACTVHNRRLEHILWRSASRRGLDGWHRRTIHICGPPRETHAGHSSPDQIERRTQVRLLKRDHDAVSM